jgi:hypothetical protein
MNTTSTSASERRSFREMLAEIVPLIDAVPGEGPPVIFLVAPWLLLALMLSGPFAFLVILLVAMFLAAAALVALTAAIVAIVAAPYLLIRRVRRYRAGRAFRFVPVRSTRVAA